MTTSSMNLANQNSSIPVSWDLKPTGAHLFRFAVIADTHINQSDDSASSFFPLNRLANRRAAQAFSMVADYQPEFVIHLGDIVHPIPSHAGFHEAAENYRTLASAFGCPIYLTPGNHDVGDKPWPLAPVAQIAPDFMRAYEAEFGAQWYEWRHRDCRFMVLNTSLFNSGLPEEVTQREWFEQALNSEGGRVFVALHYPPYVKDADEPSHYDNIDEPARSWLLGLLDTHGAEAVFCGHVHNLWYDQHAGTELYLLPSTAFVRQDYAEMQRCVPPGEEGGRQDVDKLGFFVVDVFEHGHVARFVRSAERTAPSRELLHPKRAGLPNLGIDPGYPWAAEIEIQPSGALDAFDTKMVRNDYPLFTLFDFGIRRMRVPLSDFDRPALVARFRKLARIGMRAQVVTTALPSPVQCETLRSMGDGIDALELVAHEADFARLATPLAALMARLPGVRLVLSKLRQPSDAKIDGLKYGHLIFHGWVPGERGHVEELAGLTAGVDATIEALFRVRFTESPLDVADRICTVPASCGLRAGMLVRLATDDPAVPQQDEFALCVRLLESAVAAWCDPELRVVIEGMVDFDRGYFLRLGLVDRAFNPRASGRVLRHAISMLVNEPPACLRDIERHTVDGVWTLRVPLADGTLQFVVIPRPDDPRIVDVLGRAAALGEPCIDLLTGLPASSDPIVTKHFRAFCVVRRGM